jgi:hypothetical protein
MLIIGTILAFVALAYLCWLLFALAVYALPFFAGLSAGLAAYHSGSGPLERSLSGQSLEPLRSFSVKSPWRLCARPSFAARSHCSLQVPAALAGYHAALGLAHVAIPGEGWQDAMAVAAAIIVASTALLRMTLFSSNELGYGVATGLTSSGLLSSQTLACTH